MNYLQTFAFTIFLFQSSSFCSLQRAARTASRLSSRISLQSRCLTNRRHISTETLALYAATAFGTFKAFLWWDTIKARKQSQQQEELRMVKIKVEQALRQKDAQKKAATEQLQKAYSQELSDLYATYLSAGKESFLAKVDTFSKNNNIPISQIEESFLAQKETIFHNTEQYLKVMSDNPDNADQQKTTMTILTATFHINNITQIAHALEQHQTQTNKKGEQN